MPDAEPTVEVSPDTEPEEESLGDPIRALDSSFDGSFSFAVSVNYVE